LDEAMDSREVYQAKSVELASREQSSVPGSTDRAMRKRVQLPSPLGVFAAEELIVGGTRGRGPAISISDA
jgi:hypothetical protein